MSRRLTRSSAAGSASTICRRCWRPFLSGSKRRSRRSTISSRSSTIRNTSHATPWSSTGAGRRGSWSCPDAECLSGDVAHAGYHATGWPGPRPALGPDPGRAAAGRQAGCRPSVRRKKKRGNDDPPWRQKTESEERSDPRLRRLGRSGRKLAGPEERASRFSSRSTMRRAPNTNPDGDGRTEMGLAEGPGGRVPRERDLAFETMYEFGSRVGIWRLFSLFREREILRQCSVAPSRSNAIRRSPKLS